MNYQHLTFDELVRQCGAQVGNDLELEGELVRRVVTGEVVLASAEALAEKQEEIDELQKANEEFSDKLARAETALEAVTAAVEEVGKTLAP